MGRIFYGRFLGKIIHKPLVKNVNYYIRIQFALFSAISDRFNYRMFTLPKNIDLL